MDPKESEINASISGFTRKTDKMLRVFPHSTRAYKKRLLSSSTISSAAAAGSGSAYCLVRFQPMSNSHSHDVIVLPCAPGKQRRAPPTPPLVYKLRTGRRFSQKRLSNLLTVTQQHKTTLLAKKNNLQNVNMKELALNAKASSSTNANVNNLNNLKHLSISDHEEEEDDYINEEPDFGIMFDIDGVLARGTNPLQAAIDAFKLLTDDEGQLRVPVAFVTNACNRSVDKAAQIQGWLGIEVTPDMVVHSPTPLMIMEEYHHKHVLLVGQGPVRDVAKELGFRNFCLLDDVCDAYPLLDMVNHENRKAVAKGYTEKEFPKVEAIILLGEPVKWESNLQVLVDLMVTSGKPDLNVNTEATIEQVPVIACNMDLTFMHKATMPRFGHGAFLVCLEALYKKITGMDLKYTKLVGKPCEIQFRYGEHVLNKVREKMGLTTALRKLYFVGDNPNVDVMGANMYNMYLKAKHSRRQSQAANLRLPSSRALPTSDTLSEQTASIMYSLLVGTGVFNPNSPDADKIINPTVATTGTTNKNLNTATANPSSPYHGHRDIENRPALTIPTKYCPDVYHAVKFMFQQEGFIC